MANAQKWLDENFPKNGKTKYGENKGLKRNEIKKLNDLKSTIGWNKLESHLDLGDFINLEELDCSGNDLTSLDVSKCFKLTSLKANGNKISELILPESGENLEILDLTNNNLSEKDLSYFGRFTNLKELKIGNTDKKE